MEDYLFIRKTNTCERLLFDKINDMFPNLDYFEHLRDKINKKLKYLVVNGQISKDNANRQINDYPWLYGALGKIPSKIMFICENPSIRGIEKADIYTIDGNKSNIEAQWWGGNAGTVFRPALYQLRLKTNPPNERFGWECYITNIIKQADYASIQSNRTKKEKKGQAIIWSDILNWEIDCVKPKVLFCMGGTTFGLINTLINEKKIIKLQFHKVIHYSARKSHQDIIDLIIKTVNAQSGI